MSRYYDVRCKPCGDWLGYRVNHGRVDCADLIRRRDVFEAIASASDVGIEIVDEYGVIDGRCDKSPVCACCKSRYLCALEAGHEGNCSPEVTP